jgi:hypothetical protein
MTLAETETVGVMVPVERPSSLIALSAPLDDIIAAQKSYHETCAALLDESDIQVIGTKAFKKRSAWNKLSVAFGVSTEEQRTTHERDERGRIIRTECVVRAKAPNGRVSDGLGACDRFERCCEPEICNKREIWEDTGKPTGHTHCTFPCHQAHFSNPQHDIPATAFTRASNRAKADLFGMGEVSAEEVTGDGGDWHPNDTAGNHSSAPRESSGPRMISDGQVGMIKAVANKLNYGTPQEAVKKFAGKDATPESLTMAEARKVIDGLKAEENGGPIETQARTVAPNNTAPSEGEPF